MNLPFTPNQFFGVIAAYNVAVWPAQFVLIVLWMLEGRPHIPTRHRLRLACRARPPVHFQTPAIRGTMAEMTGGSSVLCLIEAAGGSAAVPRTGSRRDYATLDACPSRFRRPQVRSRKGRFSHLTGLLASMSDPFGHGFCLLQFAGEGDTHAESHAGST